MQVDKVSIIMPVYNGEQFLQEAIDSVRAQDYENWELIVADDGSTDRTREIVSSYTDPRILYFYQENHGQASALNLALSQTTGNFITTLDADDWLPQSSLVERVNYLRTHPEHNAVYGDGFYCSEDGKPLARFSSYCLSNITGDLFAHLVVSNLFGTGAAVLIRHDSIKQRNLRYDDEIAWCQDWDFYLRLAETSSFGYVDVITVNYRLHGSNMTMKMPSKRQTDSMLKTRYKILAIPKFNLLSPEQRTKFFYDFLRNNLRGRSADQKTILDHDQFQALPRNEKARLVRILAIDHLLAGNTSSECKEWLQLARTYSPEDRKTQFMLFLLNIHPGLAKATARLYRSSRDKQQGTNPYELVPTELSKKQSRDKK